MPASAGGMPPSRASENRDRDPARPEHLLTVVFDEQHLDFSEAERARAGVAKFLERLAPGDRVHFLATGSGMTWSARLPEGKADLLAVLEKAKGLRPRSTGPEGISDFEAQQIAVHRDQRIGAEVMRRFVGTGVIADVYVPASEPESRALVADVMGEGHPMLKQMVADAWTKVQARQHATLRALARTLDGLAARPGRKTVLMLTGGFVHEPTDPDFARS